MPAAVSSARARGRRPCRRDVRLQGRGDPRSARARRRGGARPPRARPRAAREPASLGRAAASDEEATCPGRGRLEDLDDRAVRSRPGRRRDGDRRHRRREPLCRPRPLRRLQRRATGPGRVPGSARQTSGRRSVPEWVGPAPPARSRSAPRRATPTGSTGAGGRSARLRRASRWPSPGARPCTATRARPGPARWWAGRWSGRGRAACHPRCRSRPG